MKWGLEFLKSEKIWSFGLNSWVIFHFQEVQEAMRRIFYQRKQGYDTAVRSKALSMMFESGLSANDVSEIMDESTDPWNTEYDSYIQARLNNLAQRDAEIR